MSKPTQTDNQRIKVVFLGDKAVGKSSIINRFITGEYEQNLQPTVGVDYLGKNIKYKNNDYRIQLWDTAGQQKFRSLVKGYLRGADVCVFVYDCTCLNSYLSLPEWLGLFDSVANSETIKLIAANKCDKKYDEQQLQATRKALHNDNQSLRMIPEIRTSAKLGINVQEIFERILQKSQKVGKNRKSTSVNKLVTKIGQISKNRCCY